MNPSGRVTEETVRRSRGGIRILGVPVRLHFTFILLVIFIVTLGARGEGRLHSTRSISWPCSRPFCCMNSGM